MTYVTFVAFLSIPLKKRRGLLRVQLTPVVSDHAAFPTRAAKASSNSTGVSWKKIEEEKKRDNRRNVTSVTSVTKPVLNRSFSSDFCSDLIYALIGGWATSCKLSGLGHTFFGESSTHAEGSLR